MNNSEGNIDWEWILTNMRLCDRCNAYKTLDQFTGKQGKCRYCVVKRKVDKKGKPEPHRYGDDSVIYKSFDLQDIYVKDGVKPVIKLKLKSK